MQFVTGIQTNETKSSMIECKYQQRHQTLSRESAESNLTGNGERIRGGGRYVTALNRLNVTFSM